MCNKCKCLSLERIMEGVSEVEKFLQKKMTMRKKSNMKDNREKRVNATSMKQKNMLKLKPDKRNKGKMTWVTCLFVFFKHFCDVLSVVFQVLTFNVFLM